MLLSKWCHLSKNLFNAANYVVRQTLFHEGRWVRYPELYQAIKTSENYKNLPAQTAQQVLKLLDTSWESFFTALADWTGHPGKYLGRPRLPKYKKKDGEHLLIFTNQQCRIQAGYLVFPRFTGLPPVKTRVQDPFNQVRVLPRGLIYIVEIVYEKSTINLNLDKSRVLALDLGLRNLITTANNAGLTPLVIKGGVVKSINQFYNKQLAKYRSAKNHQGYGFETKRLQRLVLKRNSKIRDLFHKASRLLIDYCIANGFGRIIIGYNAGWKQEIHLGRRNNQNFACVPFYLLQKQLEYKAELVGIDIVVVDEAHTSRCSFLDGEEIGHHEIYVGRRVSRGLFRAGNGRLINADVNAAYNILRQAVPEAFLADGIEGVGLHPCSFSRFACRTKELDEICQT
jgi:putative transposase